MTERTNLTTSWQMLSNAEGVFASGTSTDGVLLAFSATAPTGDNHHTFFGDFSLSATGAGNLWAKIPEGEGHISVDDLTDSVAFGLLNVAPRINIGKC